MLLRCFPFSHSRHVTDHETHRSRHVTLNTNTTVPDFIHVLRDSFRFDCTLKRVSLIMIALSRLALWLLVTFYPLASALPALNLYDVVSPGLVLSNNSETGVSVSANVHCTKDPNWLVPAFPNIIYYDYACQNAMAKAASELISYGLDTELEFLDRSATAQTSNPQIRLPRKYVVTPRGMQSASCTVAIAMIDSLAPGDPLPGQPPGPFGSSDVATLRELDDLLGKSFLQCLRHYSATQAPDPSLGWSQVGRSGNIGIFYLGTRSVMDRRIVRALHPNLAEED